MHHGRTAFLLLFLVGVVGCQTVAPGAGSLGEAPGEAVVRGNDDPYDGWLYKWASGQGTPEERAAQQAQSPSAAPAGGPVLAEPANPQTSLPAAQGSIMPASASADPRTVDVSHLPQLPPSDSPLERYTPEEDDSKNALLDLDVEKWWNDLKSAGGLGPDETLARQHYAEGMKLFKERKFLEAAKLFQKAADRWPDSPLEEDSLFMTGESYFFGDRYGDAHDAFLMLFKKYEFSTHLETAVAREFAIGVYWLKMQEKNPQWPVTPNLTDKSRPLFDTFGNAINAFLAIRLNDPTGPLADDAVMATANAYFLLGRWEDAAYHYDMLRTEYPNSEHQSTAHVLGLQAKMRMYQGARYDGTPLEESKEIADQTLKQFRQDLGDELPRVAKARAQIDAQLAERSWMMGQYYDRNRYYGAARLYYNAILREYPDTALAPMARKRLEEIATEPDTPPDRLGWLKRTLDPNYRQPGEKPKPGSTRR